MFRFSGVVLTLWLSLAAVSALAQPVLAQPFPTPETYPRVNGSTSTALLGQLLAARALNLDVQLRRLPFSALGEVQLTLPLDIERQESARYRDFAMRHSHQGTHEAFLALLAGKSDLILVARWPLPDEQAALAKAGIELDLQPIALDAFVFLVNVQNPVNNLTLEQIRAIYSGKTTLWRPLGGADFPIMALSRPRDSGSEELMESLVMRGAKRGVFPPQTRVGEMGEIIERVASNVNALGYSVFYFERFQAPNPKTKLLAINGIVPTPQTLALQTYPLTTPVWCITRRDVAPTSGVAQLRDWLLSEEGKKLVESSGYVPYQ